MKISFLKDFIVLSESSSINEAARKLYISQPCLSKAIRQMEEELGFPILRRTKSGVALTSQGQLVLEGAKQIVKIYDSWMDLAVESPLEELTVYSSCSFSDFLVPDAVLKLKQKYPNLHITYHAVGNAEEYISPDIRKPVLVLTVCDEELLSSLSQTQGNPPVLLMHGQYECLVNQNSPVAHLETVTLEDLKSQLLMLPTGCNEVRAPCAFLGPIMTNIIQAEPNCVLEVDSLRNVIDAVRKNDNAFAVSFSPALYRYQGVKEEMLRHIPFKNQHTEGDLCLFYSNAAAKKYSEMREFIRILRGYADCFLDEWAQKQQTEE